MAVPGESGTSLASNSLMLDVLDGIHRGVAASIPGGTCAIGSSGSCDFVLADPEIAPDHLRLRFYGRQVAVDAVGGPVVVDGSRQLAQGHGCRVALPVTLELGEASIKIHRPSRRRRHPRLMAGAVLAAMVVAALLGATQTSSFSSQTLAQQAVSTAETPRGGHAAVPPGMDDVGDSLQSRIAAAGLDLPVSVSGHHVTVSGTLPQAHSAAWTDVQRWFDTTYGGQYVLSSDVRVSVPAQPPKFSFQAIWFGPNPYIVDARGNRKYPGAALGGGWVLKSIETGEITVSRNAQEFKLTL